MDDDEVLCPLCCEEMDISDRQFYPCKCGYQVCMWCWHRIKEQETGLCPACRTPYGDNPHQFSAVDVEEVLKANKEKEEAAKRERQKLKNSQQPGGGGGGDYAGALGAAGGTGGAGNSYLGGGADGSGGNAEAVLTRLSNNRSAGRMDMPHDRQQLLGMRVIRRNLVYAVGLPPNIANEDLLRKPEYFGQYGKISKIVLNRGTSAPGRPATASAYVTFVHKEDTLACILALDGFFMEGRNIRASYGTSKYCSAFMRSMKCTNPECTYLHEMGDIEDTFTKAEIQAGYVTSGRDVLARQQQIVQQALTAATGAAGTAPRKRVGGGGPSGTGKATSNPVFPAPTYDEPARTSTAHLVPPAPTPISTQKRASTTSTAIPTQQSLAAHKRSSSIGASAPAQAAARKGSIASAVGGGATAASVVAGVRQAPAQSESSASHTTLTALTPLKRTTAASKQAAKPAQAQANQEMTKLPNMRTGSKKSNGAKSAAAMSTSPSNSEAGSSSSNKNSATATASTAASTQPPYSTTTNTSEGVSSIGGDVIATPLPVAPPVSIGEPIGMSSGLPVGPSAGAIHVLSGGGPSPLSELAASSSGVDGLGGLGGEVFDGPLQSTGASKFAIGGSKDKWNSGDQILSSNSGGLFGGTGSGTIGGSSLTGSGPSGDVIGGGIIGGGHRSGSSALASMLGINLPTGSGSLQQSSSLWSSSTLAPPSQHAPISALNGSSVPLQGVIGGGGAPAHPNNSGLIGGLPIGGSSLDQHGPSGGAIGGPAGGGGSSSDIALLQSLLPGVHITSGGSGSYQNNGFGTIGSNNSGGGNSPGNWNGGSGALPSHGQPYQQNGFGVQSSLNGQPQAIGTIGQGKQRQAPGNIW